MARKAKTKLQFPRAGPGSSVGAGGGRDFVKFSMITNGTGQSLGIMMEAMPGAIVRLVHHKIMSEVAKEGKKIMKQEIKKKFRIYRDSDRRADGTRMRWQTPTGALDNSIGTKIPTLTQMKNKGVALAIIGPRTDFKATKAVKRRVAQMKTFGVLTERGTPFGEPAAAPKPLHIPKGPKGSATVQPSRYAHLANFGHKGRISQLHAKPHDYMTPSTSRLASVFPSIVNRNYQPLLIKTFNQDTASRNRSLKRRKIVIA